MREGAERGGESGTLFDEQFSVYTGNSSQVIDAKVLPGVSGYVQQYEWLQVLNAL